MNVNYRIILAILLGLVADYCRTLWLPVSYVKTDPLGGWRYVISIATFLAGGYLVWILTANLTKRQSSIVFRSAIISGAIGLLGGMIIPGIIDPTTAQGPLLGILIAGPFAFVLGLIGSLIYTRTKAMLSQNDAQL